MPLRPREHQLREASERALRAALPLEWVSQPLNDDYGLDFHIEVFGHGRPTGNAFYVQLKGTDERSLARALRMRLRVDTADYWAAQALPVLVVRYHALSESLYMEWFHAFDPHVAGLADDWQDQQTFTFTIPQERRWVAATPEQLAAEVVAFRRYRTGEFGLPVLIHVGVDETVPMTSLELASQLAAAARPINHILSFDASTPADGDATLVLRDDAVIVNLADVASVTSHRGFAESPADSLAPDAVLVAGIALDRVRQPNLSAQVAAATVPASSLLDEPDVVWWITTVFARAHRVREGLELADKLDERGDDGARFAGQMILASFLSQGSGVQAALRGPYQEVLERQAQRRLADNDRGAAASIVYSLANSHRAARNARDAIRGYRRAAVLDPSYRDAPYWNAEFAGMVYELGHPLFASRFYSRAVELGQPGMTRALLADALLHAGRYAEAAEAFKAHARFDDQSAPEWPLKAGVLGEIRLYGGDIQRRDPDAAQRIVQNALEDANPDVALVRMGEALRRDALCPAAWQWLGLLAAANEELAGSDIDMGAFARRLLVAALTERNNPEAWSNAIVALWHRSGDSEDLRHAIVCARFLTDDDVIPVLIGAAQQWDDATDAARFRAVLVAVEPPEEARDFRVRFRADSAVLHEFHFSPAAGG